MKQEKVWNKIAPKWAEYKVKRNDLGDKFFKGQDKKVLDLGCGSGRNFIKTSATVYGVDFSKKMLEFAGARAQKLGIKTILVQTSIDKLPFEDDFFDSGVMVAVLHCIKSKKKRIKVIKELHRVLKTNASAFVTVWNKTSRRLKGQAKEHRISWNVEGKKIWRDNYLYDEDELVKDFEDAGFKITKNIENRNNIMIVVQKSKS